MGKGLDTMMGNKNDFTPVGLLMANCGLFVSKYGSSGLNGEEIDKILKAE